MENRKERLTKDLSEREDEVGTSESPEAQASRFLRLPNVFRVFRDTDSIRSRKLHSVFHRTFLIVLLLFATDRIDCSTHHRYGTGPYSFQILGDIITGLFIAGLLSLLATGLFMTTMGDPEESEEPPNSGRGFQWGFFLPCILLTMVIVLEGSYRKSQRAREDGSLLVLPVMVSVVSPKHTAKLTELRALAPTKPKPYVDTRKPTNKPGAGK